MWPVWNKSCQINVFFANFKIGFYESHHRMKTDSNTEHFPENKSEIKQISYITLNY